MNDSLNTCGKQTGTTDKIKPQEMGMGENKYTQEEKHIF